MPQSSGSHQVKHFSKARNWVILFTVIVVVVVVVFFYCIVLSVSASCVRFKFSTHFWCWIEFYFIRFSCLPQIWRVLFTLSWRRLEWFFLLSSFLLINCWFLNTLLQFFFLLLLYVVYLFCWNVYKKSWILRFFFFNLLKFAANDS